MAESKPPLFDGRNYSVWAVKMEFYMKGASLWEYTQEEVAIPALRQNVMVAQIERHEGIIARKNRAVSCLHNAVSDEIFSRIISCKTTKEAWDKLATEFQGDERSKNLQILNLRTEFETICMKDSESIKDFADRLMKIVSQIWILGEELEDRRVVEKMLVSLPLRFEHKICSLEDVEISDFDVI